MLLAAVSVMWLGTAAVKADSSSNKYGITVDGNFSDWADKTKTDITEQGDDYNVKQEVLLADDDNIYFYLNMSPKHGNGYSTLQPSGYNLKVGNQTYYLTLKGYDGLSTDSTKPVTVNVWSSSVSADVANAGAVHRYKTDNGTNDVVEMVIPLSTLKVSGSTSQSISMSNANLGTQTLTATGGSTGPVVLASVGFILAIGGVLAYTKRKKLKV